MPKAHHWLFAAVFGSGIGQLPSAERSFRCILPGANLRIAC
ncbi:hypothetical protein M5D96_000560 [Drosophila gunungcola]|uniref:Uncharacterized protein n=1 Tax=Drosophila gunungcola TaxID=103775 RepID=A0A9Q0BTR4_9MUSC|nr:hypothetical protein M5D96_000560 [Drosophila gunungcola]